MTHDLGLRVGVVGCGYWGSKHVRVLHSTDGVDQVVLIDGSAERLRSLARSYPAAQAFTTLTDALPHIDALVVATPPTTQRALLLRWWLGLPPSRGGNWLGGPSVGGGKFS